MKSSGTEDESLGGGEVVESSGGGRGSRAEQRERVTSRAWGGVWSVKSG